MKVNIYLTKEQKNKLEQLSWKYQVSKSTIAENLLFLFTKYALRQENHDEIIKKLGSEYLTQEKGTKTSIKPRVDPVNIGLYGNLTKAYTNVIYLYLTKQMKNYIFGELISYFYNDLNNKLQTTNEPNWDYNRFVRQMHKYQERKQA